MDKKQYQQLMEQIQMPASCEQRILEQIQQQDAFEPHHHRFSWQKKLGIAVAAAVCISVVSVFSAAAAQNRSLLELLFPQTETTSVSEQLIATARKSTART